MNGMPFWSVNVMAGAAVVALLTVAPVAQKKPHDSAPPSPCAAPTRPSTDDAEGIRADYLLRRIAELGAFSGSVLIARGDRLLLHAGYGLASEDPCVAAGPETVYHIGSVAKQFAAAAALRLEEQGRWRMHEPIGRFLPDAPADKRAITIHQLLTHTSGLVAEVVEYGDEHRAMERDTIIDRILRSPLVSTPGTEYRYSNAGYTLLTALIERTSGEGFEPFVERELFSPAGLHHTGFVGDTAKFRDLQVARGFWGRYEVPTPDRRPSWAILPGDVLSSVGDLARWYRALREGRVLSAESVRRMFEPHANGYAYGWHIRTRDDGSVGVIFHNGDQGEYAVAFRHYPRSGLITVAATNRVVQDAKQHDDVLNNALEVLGGATIDLPAPRMSGAVKPAAGEYRQGEGVYQLRADAAGDLWLAPQSEAAFRALFGHVTGFAVRSDAAMVRTTAFEDSLRSLPSVSCSDGRTPHRRGSTRQYVGEWDGLICDLVADLGPHLRTEPVGAQPLSWSRSRTLVFARHVHLRGSRMVTWLWDDDRPVEAWSSPSTHLPQSARLAPAADGYVVFDWFTGNAVGVRFEPDAHGGIRFRVGENARER